QLDGILHTHAAVAEGADGAAEQMPLRGVVHVDVVLVGKAELDDTEHVGGTRWLSEVEALDVDARPVDGIGVDRAPAAADVQTITSQYRGGSAGEKPSAPGIAQQRGQLIGFHTRRYAPGGVEDDELHVGGEDRRGRARFANHDFLGEDLFALV